MDNTQKQIWYSGDWNRSGKNIDPPYNGVEISAVSTFGTTENSSAAGKLVSIDLTVTDFTYDPKGLSSTFTMSKTDVWCEIPVPMDDTVTPSIVNPNFTITSTNGNGPGMVRIDTTPTGNFLNIQFQYGLKNMKRQVIGYIMRFQLDGAIEVE